MLLVCHTVRPEKELHELIVNSAHLWLGHDISVVSWLVRTVLTNRVQRVPLPCPRSSYVTESLNTVHSLTMQGMCTQKQLSHYVLSSGSG